MDYKIEDMLPYVVKFEHSNDNRTLAAEMIMWTTDRLGNRWSKQNNTAQWGYFPMFETENIMEWSRVFRFKHEEHAVWFALTWQ